MSTGKRSQAHDTGRSWRDAHLGERDSRDASRERERHRERDYRSYDRDRDRDREREYRGYGREREHDRRGKRGDWRRDREHERSRDRDWRSPRSAREHDRDWRRPRDTRSNGGAGGRDDGHEEGDPRRSASPRRHEHASPRRHDYASPRRSDHASPRRRDADTAPRGAPQPPQKKVRVEAPPSARKAEPEQEPVADAEPEDDEDLEKKLEEKRRRREAILAKFRAGEGAKPPLSAVTSATVSAAPSDTASPTTPSSPLPTSGINSVTAGTPAVHSPTLPSTPMGKDFDLEKHGEAGPPPEAEGVSAAEYDAASDKAERGARVLPEANGKVEAAAPTAADDEWEEVEIEVDDDDDADVDMFAAFGDDEPVKKKRKVKVRRRKDGAVVEQAPTSVQAVLDIVDNADDTEGYYRITPGEILDDGRYQVTVTLGKGMFSAVVKAKVLKAVGQERAADVVGREVAIKLMRSQESMYVAGRKEAQILKQLNDADPEDRKHIVRMEHTFEHRGHLAIVTESLSMNLRDVIKRFGKDIGLNMRAVRAYAHQMLLALSLMRKCNIVHADIKPDNVLVSENKAILKVCDLGTAAEVSEGEVTPYLVSRFYRAPEIILGLPYDTAIDIWAIGCTLFELYTGKILFPGRSNNHMLLLMMETKGKLPHRMIKKSTLGHMHFDETNNFLSAEKDRITGADVIKTVSIQKATRDLRSRLMPSSSVQAKMGIDELKQLQQFVDLLDKCLMLDPVRRISPREALLHPFITGHA